MRRSRVTPRVVKREAEPRDPKTSLPRFDMNLTGTEQSGLLMEQQASRSLYAGCQSVRSVLTSFGDVVQIHH
jgi:hypothetical protein